MNFNFELILFYATLICGVIALLDVIFWAPQRKHTDGAAKKMPIIIDYSRSFFPILLLVFLVRSFLYEPFRIPSGSLKPTLTVGDFILVNKFDLGVRLPLLHKKIYPVNDVKRGDIVVFRFPPKPSIDYIKRIVGVPGDHISYINKVLYINGTMAAQEFQRNTTDQDERGDSWEVVEKQENLLGVKHSIYQTATKPDDDFKDNIVPKGMYFAMGDNRDDSADSRYWGYVPDSNIVGKASLIWISWNANADWKHKIRWNRFGTVIR